MFTIDAVVIATELARSLGMGTNAPNFDSMENVRLPCEPEISTLVEETDVYPEVLPQQKETIVRILQSRGHLVAATGDDVNDLPTLKRAECGIAVEGSVETAQAAARFVFKKSGFTAIIQTIERSRQIFQLTYSFIVYRTAVTLYLVIFLVGYFATYNETLDPNLILLVVHLSDIIGVALRYDDEITPYPKSPARWTLWRVFPSVVLLSTVLVLGSWSAIINISDQVDHSPAGPAEASAIRVQISFLHIVLSSNWLILLTRTSGRFWAHTQCWQVILTILFIGLGATVLCTLGYVGSGHVMSIEAVRQVWAYSFGTVCVAAGLLCHLVDEPMIERQISGKKVGKEGLSPKKEEGKKMGEEGSNSGLR